VTPPLHSGDLAGLPPFDLCRVFTRWELEPVLFVGLVCVSGAYLYGVLVLRARGDRWPLTRTLSFVVLGMGLLAFATMSGLGGYDRVLLSVHMVQHMLLSMLVPMLLALGAPVTLMLRTLPAPPRTWLLALLHSRLAKVLTFAPLTFLLFVISPWALYFTGWYDASLRSDLVHELMHVHLVLVGSLFFWPLVGVDPVPGRVGHPFRMLMLFATLPFHAFLGVAIMSVKDDGSGLIAASHYLPLRGLEGAVFQQQVGGGALWSSGDLIGLLFMVVTLTQWMRASEREARREDRRLDRADASALTDAS